MNILHVKYAAEVARLGSLSRAAESLLVAQPNISRSIKELEGDLGITIFHRTPKGMTLTPASQKMLDKYGLVLRACEGNKKVYKDVLIYQKGYKLTHLDRAFIDSLAEAKQKFLN